MKLGNDPPADLVLTPLEQAVLQALANSAGDAAAVLGTQREHAEVLGRSHSGVGFVTRLRVPDDVAPVSGTASNRAHAVHATHPQLEEPAEFLVQLKAGRLASIEAYCSSGMWPADESGFHINTRGRAS